MFELEIGDKTYKFNCKLGVTIKIKNKFGKPFMELIKELGDMDIQDMIKLLHCALVDDTITYKEFETELSENAGLLDLIGAIQVLVRKIQDPKLEVRTIQDELKNEMTETLQ